MRTLHKSTILVAAVVAVAIVMFSNFMRTPKLERRGAIEALLPSVVRITTRTMAPAGVAPNIPSTADAGVKVQESFGSGFVIDRSGYIVTNRHVVKDAYEIVVTLSNGKALQARLIGHGNDVDLALLKVETSQKLNPVKFGDSDKVEIGDEVMAIGNPFGLGTTLTAGVVSALNRDLGFSRFDSFIQTDAAINRGNSGGPLFNMRGEVIGVNTSYYSGSGAKGGSIGLGFAIPSETVLDVVALLRKYGRTKLGWIGIEGPTLTPEMIGALGLDNVTGGIIAAVSDEGPAAGVLQPGDILLAVGRKQLADMRMFQREVAGSVGETLRLRILRDGLTRTVQITPVEWPGGKAETDRPVQPLQRVASMPTDLGLDLGAIDAVSRREFNIPVAQSGVLVTNVRTQSPASESGMHIGDVIVSLQLKPVSSPSDAKARIDEAIRAKREFVVALVRTRDQFSYKSLPLKWRAQPQ